MKTSVVNKRSAYKIHTESSGPGIEGEEAREGIRPRAGLNPLQWWESQEAILGTKYHRARPTRHRSLPKLLIQKPGGWVVVLGNPRVVKIEEREGEGGRPVFLLRVSEPERKKNPQAIQI